MLSFLDAIEAVDGHAHIGLWNLDFDELRLFFPLSALSASSAGNQKSSEGDIPDMVPRLSLEELLEGRESCAYELTLGAAFTSLYGETGVPGLRRRVKEERARPMLSSYVDCLARANVAYALSNVPVLTAELAASETVRWVPYLDQFIIAGNNESLKQRDPLIRETVELYELGLESTLADSQASLEELTLQDFCELIDSTLLEWAAGTASAVKLNCAYLRSLEFGDVPRDTAMRYWQERTSGLTPSEETALQDYLARFAISRCARHGLVIQIHAAVGDAPPLLWRNADPSVLEGIFRDPALGHPSVVLLHGGIPNAWLAGWYAATYANVFIDFSWLPFLAPRTLERCLDEWLDYVPNNKILFGTDAWAPELLLAGAEGARKVLSSVLTRRVSSHEYSVSMAEQVASNVMRENALRLYRIGG